MMGAPLLCGDNTSPGLKITDELRVLIPDIFKLADKIGLSYYPTVIQKLTYDQISEVASYGGFGVRYPHWRWGMEYESLQKGYEYGFSKIFEMVVNNDPCWIYCLDSNSLLSDITVIIHALGHNHFFKNNIYFAGTNTNMMNQLADHAVRIREYIDRWGKEKVIEFIDHVLRLETLIDPSDAFSQRTYKSHTFGDKKKQHYVETVPVREGHDHMDSFLNPQEWLDKQKANIRLKEAADELGIDEQCETKNILKFLKENAPLKPWQRDIMGMIYEEALYFVPQRHTKMINEGFASFIDHVGMIRHGLVSLGQPQASCGIIEYSKHKSLVLGGKYSMNPYKLGYNLLLDIEERWNKGWHGSEYEKCNNLEEKLAWDTKANKGYEKVFEVAALYNDAALIRDFFTPEFCEKYEFFEYALDPEDGNYKIVNRDCEKIRNHLIKRYTNAGLPDIRKVDSNHRGQGKLLLEHHWTGKTLYEKDLRPVMQSMYTIWQQDVVLTSRDANGSEIVYACNGTKDDNFHKIKRSVYEA